MKTHIGVRDMSDEHTLHHANDFRIFVFLCILTALSWFFDEMQTRKIIETKAFIITAVLAVAVAKALFVMMYFMHLKFEGRWKFVLLTPTIILAIGIPLALLPDVGLHYYHVDIPQNDSSVSVSHHGETEQAAENNGH